MSTSEEMKKRTNESDNTKEMTRRDDQLEENQSNEGEEKETELKEASCGPDLVVESDIEKLQKRLTETEGLVNSYKDQLLRLAAEFENFRKRLEIERADFVKFSNEKIIKDLIPVLDDFERAIAKATQNSDGESFRKGVELIYQKFSKLLQDKGLKPIESVGKEFDVMYHDVLMQVPSPGVTPDTIVEEVERGYTLHGKVIKHAKVIVAAPSGDSSQKNQAN